MSFFPKIWGGIPCDGFRLLSRGSQKTTTLRHTQPFYQIQNNRPNDSQPQFSPHSATAFCKVAEHHDAALRPVAQGASLLSFPFFSNPAHHHHKLGKSRARCHAGQNYIPVFAVRLSGGNVTPYKVICRPNLEPPISHLFIVTLCRKQRQCLTGPADSMEVAVASLVHSSLFDLSCWRL